MAFMETAFDLRAVSVLRYRPLYLCSEKRNMPDLLVVCSLSRQKSSLRLNDQPHLIQITDIRFYTAECGECSFSSSFKSFLT